LLLCSAYIFEIIEDYEIKRERPSGEKLAFLNICASSSFNEWQIGVSGWEIASGFSILRYSSV
jgi:hypothetical protein